MATVKIKFRPSSVDGREGTVYYQGGFYQFHFLFLA